MTGTTYVSPALAECPICLGSGFDAVFQSTCHCEKFVGRSNLSERLAAANAGAVTYVERTGGTGGAQKSTSIRPTFAATDKQIAFLRRLVAERDPQNPAVQAVMILLDRPLQKRDASNAIDAMMAIRPGVARAEIPQDRRIAPQNRPGATQTGLDLSGVPSGLYAVPGGDTRLKIKIDNCEGGKWAGWVFVKDGAEYGMGKRYGKQRPGGRYEGDLVEQLTAIAADPFEGSKAYGRLVGRCGMCSRPLEDETSVANGIGPICAKKFA